MTLPHPTHPESRRRFLARAAALGLATPFGLVGSPSSAGLLPVPDLPGTPICRVAAEGPAPKGTPRPIKLAWNASAICTAAAPVAKESGVFARHGLDVEFVNFGGSTEQLLEAIATGKADAGIGMALRWLKPWSRVSTSRSRPASMAAACGCSAPPPPGRPAWRR